MKTETIQLTADPNVTLMTYLPQPSEALPNMAARRAVLICPGGSYLYCSDREGEPIALAFMAAGYQAFVLRYSVGEFAAFPRPLMDAENALELIRARAEEWQVDPGKIAACGFSGGGRLGAGLGNMGRGRPNAQIFAFPCLFDDMY